MKSRWQTWQAKYWQTRPRQERQIMLFAAAILLPPLFYFALWQPSHHAVTQLNQRMPKLNLQAVKLAEQAVEIEKLRHRAPLANLSVAEWSANIEASATRQQLRAALKSVVPEGHLVRISSDAIEFAKLQSWLRELQQEQHIRVESIEIKALAQTGMVQLNATLVYESAQ